MTKNAEYYKSAYRAMIGGVPCRLARKPGPSTKRCLRETGHELAKPMWYMDQSRGMPVRRSLVTRMTEREAYAAAITQMRAAAAAADLPLPRASTPIKVKRSPSRKVPAARKPRAVRVPAKPIGWRERARRALIWAAAACVEGMIGTTG